MATKKAGRTPGPNYLKNRSRSELITMLEMKDKTIEDLNIRNETLQKILDAGAQDADVKLTSTVSQKEYNYLQYAYSKLRESILAAVDTDSAFRSIMELKN